MGGWGLSLFESDYDHDILADLSGQLARAGYGKCRLGYGDMPGGGNSPQNQRTILDKGGLAYLISKYEDKITPNDMPAQHTFDTPPKYVLVLLGAAAMHAGASLPADFRAFLRDNYPHVGLLRDALLAMYRASEDYKDGVAFDFESVTLLEIMANRQSDDGDRLHPSRPGANFTMLKTPSPGPTFLAVPQRLYENPLIDMLKRNKAKAEGSGAQSGGDTSAVYSCASCGSKKGENNGQLRVCGGYRRRHYCSASCQKLAWKGHKKNCGKASKERA